MAVVRCSLRAGAGFWLASALLVGATIVADIVSAQPINGRARWCVTFPDNGTYDCAYHSLEQCVASAVGVSNQCSLNPWYDKRLDVYPRPRSPYWPFF